MKQSNTSELTKLHHSQIFLGEVALNSPTKPVAAKLLFLFLYLCNIICEIFYQKNLCKYTTKCTQLLNFL